MKSIEDGKIGDSVIVIKNNGTYISMLGMVGKIVSIYDDSFGIDFGKRVGDNDTWCLNNDECPDKTGRYFEYFLVDLYKPYEVDLI